MKMYASQVDNWNFYTSHLNLLLAYLQINFILKKWDLTIR